jgi:hypothetical protein
MTEVGMGHKDDSAANAHGHNTRKAVNHIVVGFGGLVESTDSTFAIFFNKTLFFSFF